MKWHRGSGRAGVAKVWVAVVAVASLGASPPESWEAVRPSLPPVTVAPNLPPPAAMPLPMPMPPRPPVLTPPRVDRAVVPAGKQTPGLPAMMPARPATPTPTPAIPAPLPAPSKPMTISPAPVAVADITSFAVPNTRVYVINGLDPFGWGGLSQMADRIRDSGYPDTRFGRWYQSLRYEREIRQMHRDDPSAQVVLIGYSLGVYRAKAMANRLTRDGIPVAMVGYIGGDYLRNTPSSTPGGVPVVNVTGNGYLLTGKNLFFNGTEISGADNVRLPGVNHFGLPKQEQTLNALVNGMNAATGRGWSVPSASGVAGTPSGVPGAIAVGPEVIPQPQLPITSAASPISTRGRR
jgi:hypothetical protein